ncbi:E3 ubiquitin-protein ligase E3D [Sporothrix curviconia]|uniref:E3 ubiquitin-protein ligase E3D n=1 Tax=Sporothrix curviconia TaxID=1260050 RepID=A0ABP0CJP9_9PEZI
MPTPPVQLYAELLANIRQVSVSASFDGPLDATRVTAAVLSDGETLRIQKDGQTLATMTLPGRVAVAGGGSKPLPMRGPALAAGSMTWRLPVAAVGGTRSDDDSLAPWSAPDLPAKTRVACRACDTEIVAGNTIREWKDLPSDNWAEMMEFWHCHKPDTKDKKTPKGDKNDGKTDEANKDEARLADRGYGANSIILAENGVGFVDLTTLSFSEDDCQSLLFSTSTADKALTNRNTLLESAPFDIRGLHIYCPSCRAQVGYLTLRRQQSIHLFKWQVSVAGADSTAPTITDCVAATLVATIQRTGSSKSFFLPIYELEGGDAVEGEDKGEERVLHIWVLNSNIGYAAWPAETVPGPAIKLLYRFVARKEADKTLDRPNSDVQEINLPRETIAAVVGLLQDSNGLLPPRDRLFQEWKIALLGRWRR